jgi:hypothetical protein
MGYFPTTMNAPISAITTIGETMRDTMSSDFTGTPSTTNW